MQKEDSPIYWKGDCFSGNAVIIDQTLLPGEKKLLKIENIEQMWQAIKSLQVRGAPAIGIAAAYGVVLGVRRETAKSSRQLFPFVEKAVDYLKTSRPTAVNLFWALERMLSLARSIEGTAKEVQQTLWQEAEHILEEDMRLCHAIGEAGKTLIHNDCNILTHCNAGGLATSGYGTALAVIFSAVAEGKKVHVYVDETRPLWQGARLTAWELIQRNIPATLICDNTAPFVMQQKKVDLVVTGADRIAANGDTANKIGTYGLAVAAAAHNIPFYIAAPFSTFDFSILEGKQIPIEERSSLEVTNPGGLQIAPQGMNVYSPAFDITPAHLIAGIITDQGILEHPLSQSIAKLSQACRSVENKV